MGRCTATLPPAPARWRRKRGPARRPGRSRRRRGAPCCHRYRRCRNRCRPASHPGAGLAARPRVSATGPTDDILMAGGCPAESPALRDTAGIRCQVPAAPRNGFPARARAGQPHDHLTSTETTLSLGDVCTLFGEARRLAPSAVGRAGRRRGGWRGRGRCRADDHPVGSTATWLRTRRNCTNPSRPRRTGRRHEMETTTTTGHTCPSRAATWPAAPPLATTGSTGVRRLRPVRRLRAAGVGGRG